MFGSNWFKKKKEPLDFSKEELEILSDDELLKHLNDADSITFWMGTRIVTILLTRINEKLKK